MPQWAKGSSVAAAVVLLTAAAQIQSLTWELPYIMGVAIKKKKETNSVYQPKKVLLLITSIYPPRYKNEAPWRHNFSV